jgi:hypothetical protein
MRTSSQVSSLVTSEGDLASGPAMEQKQLLPSDSKPPIERKEPVTQPLSLMSFRMQFDEKFKEQQKARPVFNEGKSFFASNDDLHFWSMPLAEREKWKMNVRKEIKQVESAPVSLFVGEGDLLSFCREDVPGDIIIMDSDSKLLTFINELVSFSKEIYEKYSQKKISFRQVVDKIIDFYSRETNNDFLEARKEFLSVHHWLYDEENYQAAMKKLASCEVVTVNIDLFSEQEVNFFKELLVKKYIPVYVNLTNLGDYDVDLRLDHFLKMLNMPSFGLLQWNVHDRGLGGDKYEHYLFYSSDINKSSNDFSNEFSRSYKEQVPYIVCRATFTDDSLIFARYSPEKLRNVLKENGMLQGFHGLEFIEAYLKQYEKWYKKYLELVADEQAKEKEAEEKAKQREGSAAQDDKASEIPDWRLDIMNQEKELAIENEAWRNLQNALEEKELEEKIWSGPSKMLYLPSEILRIVDCYPKGLKELLLADTEFAKRALLVPKLECLIAFYMVSESVRNRLLVVCEVKKGNIRQTLESINKEQIEELEKYINKIFGSQILQALRLCCQQIKALLEKISDAKSPDPASIDDGLDAKSPDQASIDDGLDAKSSDPASIDDGLDAKSPDPASIDDEGLDAKSPDPASIEDEGLDELFMKIKEIISQDISKTCDEVPEVKERPADPKREFNYDPSFTRRMSKSAEEPVKQDEVEMVGDSELSHLLSLRQ